ncbi:DUF1845 domain-containing protein [Azohydromonas aeria]|uniref:DUF1845 domain-containing protein n=1 Tax=Azohydromonas aeria TaxID=2590212 RepID=UPI0012F765B5|nr:DUF1845 domain-containing protein [Azohydromonas aeria]
MPAQTPLTIPGSRFTRADEGRINERILARRVTADYRRVEGASVKMTARFHSAEAKRLFVRMFATLQLNTHFISVIARAGADHEEIARIEATLRQLLEEAIQGLDQAIDGAEALFQAHGIRQTATYDAQPLEVEVPVLSSFGRRYLEVLGRLDRIMPMLQTLEIHDVISVRELDAQRAALKRQGRGIAIAARGYANLLRRRMNALASGHAGAERPALPDAAPPAAVAVLPAPEETRAAAAAPEDDTAVPDAQAPQGDAEALAPTR